MIEGRMRPLGRRGMAALILHAVLGFAGAHAQSYPARAVRIIVPQAPGSSADAIARMVATKLGEKWPAAVVVENRPGANGNVGMDAVAKSAPDGYTLGLAVPSTMTVNPLVYKTMPFKPQEDLAAVSQLTAITFGMFANPQLPARTPAELVAYAKTRPQGLNFSSAGVGNLGHLAAELFAAQTGVPMTHVPNKGDTPGLMDVMSGQTDAMFAPLPSGVSFVQGGRLRLLAIASPRRSPLFPEVPTLGESGIPNVVTEGWTGLVVPAGTPPATIAIIQKAVAGVLADPEVAEAIRKQGFDVAGSTSEQFATLMRQESKKWSDLIAARSLKLGD
ncbi:tripartite tricarboxylate transporter substrate binding protein BugE [Pigmentiphaga soli]|uniref:Tripartite tricarboxylate transporter substrate binding protein BugE n=1 Tax=Pigmentiphaga soli TaxID=1007095 RepID=A0ABP8GRZ8_9BURK